MLALLLLAAVPVLHDAANDDIARLRAHFARVELTLRASAPALSPEQSARREQLLDVLHAYAAAGRFPHNDVFPGPTPIFIDAHDTPCAVARLLIASGEASFAREIARRDVTVRVLALDDARLGAWADKNGFTLDELAWIQPTYGPTPSQVLTREGCKAAQKSAAAAKRFLAALPAKAKAAAIESAKGSYDGNLKPYQPGAADFERVREDVVVGVVACATVSAPVAGLMVFFDALPKVRSSLADERMGGALTQAVFAGKRDTVIALLDAGVIPPATAVLAAAGRDVDVLRRMLDAGASATTAGHCSELVVVGGNMADVSCPTLSDGTLTSVYAPPLHMAAAVGDLDAVALLLARGADASVNASIRDSTKFPSTTSSPRAVDVVCRRPQKGADCDGVRALLEKATAGKAAASAPAP